MTRCVILTVVDECTEATHNCGITAECEDVEDGFRCRCPTGYEEVGDGRSCNGMCTVIVGPRHSEHVQTSDHNRLLLIIVDYLIVFDRVEALSPRVEM